MTGGKYLAALLAVPLLLSGCVSGAQVLGKATELAQTRIARQTTFNDAKLNGCLDIAEEVRRGIIAKIAEGDLDQMQFLLAEYRILMDSCRPLLLVEEGKRVVE